MALANMGFKDKKLVSFWEREENVKEEEEEEEKKRRRGKGDQASQGKELWIFVWKLTLIIDSMRFGMDLWFCMVIILPQI